VTRTLHRERASKIVKAYLRNRRLLRRLKPRISSLMNPIPTPSGSLAKLIDNRKSIVLFDVGANVGQFGIDMRNSGFIGEIYSYEPVESVFTILQKTSRKYRPWESINLALGSMKQISKINISSNSSLSSSLLSMSNAHISAFPQSFTTKTEEVQITTLDEEISRLNVDPANVILKIDVQGFESEVIKGGLDSIPKIGYILLELSLLPLYTGEKTFLDVAIQLENLGHRVIDIHRGAQLKSGELLQVDVITKNIN